MKKFTDNDDLLLESVDQDLKSQMNNKYIQDEIIL